MASVKVLHLITSLNCGGAEASLYKLIASSDRSRFSHTVISLLPGGRISEQLRELGIPVVSVGLKPGSITPGKVLELVYKLKAERPDVLQTWLYHSDFLGCVAGALAGVPAIGWNIRCSNVDLRSYSRLLPLLLRALAFLSPRPQFVIANSEAGREVHKALGYRPRRWEIVPNGFDTRALKPSPELHQKLRSDLGFSEKAMIIGLVARFDPMKDHRTFLEAGRILLSRYKGEVRFVMIGAGVEKSNSVLMDWIHSAGLSERVHLLGERSDVPSLLPGFDIASLSSIGEGFPNVIGEAMSCGVICVATDVGDTAKIIGETGLTVSPRNPAALASAWLKILEMSSEERNRLSALARARVEANYSLQSSCARYESIYSEFGDKK